MKTNGILTITFPFFAIAISILAYFYPNLFMCFSDKISYILGVIMFFMGATLNFGDFAAALKKPKAVLLGVFLQFTIMPLVAYIISKCFGLDESYLIGMVLVGSVAGGTASNIMTYFARGDLALSVTMTIISTSIGTLATPFIIYALLGQRIDIPVFKILQDIFYIITVPICLGIFVNVLFAGHKKLFVASAPIISVVGILLVIATVVAINAGAIGSFVFIIALAVIMHNVSGIALGYFISRLLHFEKKTAITIAIEVGMQNSGLAALLAKNFFSSIVAIPAVIFSIWHNISGVIFASIANRFILKDSK